MKAVVHILALAVLGCVVACSLTASTAWMLGFGTQTRAAVVALQGGRLALVYHAPSLLQPGLIIGSEPALPSARTFLLPYVVRGRRAMVSIPLYVPVLPAAVLTLWRWQKRRAHTRGFTIIATAGEQPARLPATSRKA